MAQLAGGTQWACAELAIENNPAADTGAQREEDEVAREAAVSFLCAGCVKFNFCMS